MSSKAAGLVGTKTPLAMLGSSFDLVARSSNLGYEENHGVSEGY